MLQRSGISYSFLSKHQPNRKSCHDPWPCLLVQRVIRLCMFFIVIKAVTTPIRRCCSDAIYKGARSRSHGSPARPYNDHQQQGPPPPQPLAMLPTSKDQAGLRRYRCPCNGAVTGARGFEFRTGPGTETAIIRVHCRYTYGLKRR